MKGMTIGQLSQQSPRAIFKEAYGDSRNFMADETIKFVDLGTNRSRRPFGEAVHAKFAAEVCSGTFMEHTSYHATVLSQATNGSIKLHDKPDTTAGTLEELETKLTAIREQVESGELTHDMGCMEVGKSKKKSAEQGTPVTEEESVPEVGEIKTLADQKLQELLNDGGLSKMDLHVLGEMVEQGDSKVGWLKDVCEQGTQSGSVGKMISYADTHAFFDKFSEDIFSAIETYQEDTGERMQFPESNIKDWLARFGYENSAQKIADRIGVFEENLDVPTHEHGIRA